jgi:hypothetical protein
MRRKLITSQNNYEVESQLAKVPTVAAEVRIQIPLPGIAFGKY